MFDFEKVDKLIDDIVNDAYTTYGNATSSRTVLSIRTERIAALAQLISARTGAEMTKLSEPLGQTEYTL